MCRSRHVKKNGRNIFLLTFALVTGRVPKIFVLTYYFVVLINRSKNQILREIKKKLIPKKFYLLLLAPC